MRVGGAHSLHLPSPVKLQCTLQLSGQICWPCFISCKDMYSVIYTTQRYEGERGEGGGGRRCIELTLQLFPRLFRQLAVFPTGWFFGRITQKGPSGRTILWQNFGRIFPEMAEKGPNIKNVLFPEFFPYETLKNLEFSKILVQVRFKKCSNILMKWNQRCYFY